MDKLALKHVLGRMWKQKEEAPSSVSAGADTIVLIVDDSRTICHVFALMLEREGYTTITAADGAQAVVLAKRHKPNLILMDIVMPVMNGFEATRLLMNDSETKTIPIVMVSGTNLPSDKVWSKRLGAKGYLAKPVMRDVLLTKVRSVLALARYAEASALPREFPTEAARVTTLKL